MTFPCAIIWFAREAGLPSLEAGIRYEALHYQRLFAAETYETWLPRLLEGQKTVWLMYWSGDKSAFNWLEELDFKRSAAYVHRHDGGVHGETLLPVYRFDHTLENEPVARFATV